MRLVSIPGTLGLAAGLALAAPAFAQYDAPEDFGEDTPFDDPYAEETETPGDTVSFTDESLSGGVPAPAVEPGLPGPPPTFNAAPQTYVVQSGDTLWDISQRFLNNPWYWPKLWSFNPQIENANWIEPGDVISFQGTGRTETLEGPTEVDPPDDIVTAPPTPDEIVTVSEGRELFKKIPTSVRHLDHGFVTVRQLEASGEIVASFEEKILLSNLDQVYLRFPRGTTLGARYSVFRTIRAVSHPRTGKLAGYHTEILGDLEIVDTGEGSMPTGRIIYTQDAMERGDRLVPWTEAATKTLVPTQNQVELEGVILATLTPKLVAIGEHHYVVVDKGSRDGVSLANTFNVYRQGDPLDRDNLLVQTIRQRRGQPLPWEDIGLLLVVELREESSTCLVMRSVREIERNDRVLMRVPPVPTAMR